MLKGYATATGCRRQLVDVTGDVPPGGVTHLHRESGRRVFRSCSEQYVDRPSSIARAAAAVHLIHVGDIVILIAYKSVPDAEARAFRPCLVHVNAANRILALGTDPTEAPTIEYRHRPTPSRADITAFVRDRKIGLQGTLRTSITPMGISAFARPRDANRCVLLVRFATVDRRLP